MFDFINNFGIVCYYRIDVIGSRLVLLWDYMLALLIFCIVFKEGTEWEIFLNEFKMFSLFFTEHANVSIFHSVKLRGKYISI